MIKLIAQVDICPSKLSFTTGNNNGNIGTRGRHVQLIEHCKRTVQDYARLIGADYHCITEPTTPETHPWIERFQFFEDDWDYDQVLYLDIDVEVVTEDNFFDLFGNEDFIKCYRSNPQWNSGVYGFGRDVKKWFRDHVDYERMMRRKYKDQEELNYLTHVCPYDVLTASEVWNCNPREDAKFIHHKGATRVNKSDSKPFTGSIGDLWRDNKGKWRTNE